MVIFQLQQTTQGLNYLSKVGDVQCYTMVYPMFETHPSGVAWLSLTWAPRVEAHVPNFVALGEFLHWAKGVNLW